MLFRSSTLCFLMLLWSNNTLQSTEGGVENLFLTLYCHMCHRPFQHKQVGFYFLKNSTANSLFVIFKPSSVFLFPFRYSLNSSHAYIPSTIKYYIFSTPILYFPSSSTPFCSSITNYDIMVS